MTDEHKKLLEKVNELYQKYGIKSVTMDDVSRELGISKKTLYQYVQNKEELVQQVIIQKNLKNEERYKSVTSGELNAIESLIEVNKLVCSMMREHNPSIEYDLKKYYPEIYARLRKVSREKMYDGVLANLIQGKKEGLYREDLNEVIIAKLYVSRILNLSDDDIFTKEEMMHPDFGYNIMLYHIRGVANEKGLGILDKILSNN